MTKSKLFQNLNVDAKPASTVKPAAVQQTRPKRGSYGHKKYKDTNLKISTHQRNKLIALTLMGQALNQKDAVSFLLDEYYKKMKHDERKQFDALVEMLDLKYSKLHHEK